MSNFAMFFSYTPDTWAKMLADPSDRTPAVSSLVAGVGGTLHGLYFMLGEKDGFVLFDAPDAESAAALALAVTSTGAFSAVQTGQLIEAGDLPAVLRTADSARGHYRPPGD
ncbi:GYD domain-containing protein [Actinomycetospora sp.]|jgi:uncharacterized protein with GYD domain|uniref:GYD domain-containing protein n=1 Tax=Actinomycetospora sp. TaxID=1872135 RepID=UPI002F41E901